MSQKKRWCLGRWGRNRHNLLWTLQPPSALNITGTTTLPLNHFALCFSIDYRYLILFKLAYFPQLFYFKKIKFYKGNLKN